MNSRTDHMPNRKAASMLQQNRAAIVTSRITRASSLLVVMALCVATLCPLSARAQEPTAPPATTTTAPAAAASEPAAPAKRVVDYNNPTLEDILDAWKEREEKVKSFKIVWDQNNTIYPLPASIQTDSFQRSMYPEKERTQLDRGLSFASFENRYCLVSFTTQIKDPSVPVIPEWDRFNGFQMGHYYKAADPRDRYGSGLIYKSPNFDSIIRHSIAPVLALYRPLYQVCAEPVLLATAGKDFSTLGLTVMLGRTDDGKASVSLARAGKMYTYFVRASEGFPVCEIHTCYRIQDGNWSLPIMMVEVEVEEHVVAGVAPIKWTTTFRSAIGEFTKSVCQSTRTQLTINELIPDAEFDPLAFPIGTVVEDCRLVENPDRQPGPRFWQRENGLLEPIDEDAEYEAEEVVLQELRKKDRQRLQQTSFVGSDAFLWLQVVAFVLLFVIWYRRRHV